MNAPSVAILLLRIFVSLFLAILFLQSGIDKIVDRRGNLEWLKGHFAKSPLAGMVPLMVTVITLLELAAGALSAAGCVLLVVSTAQQLPFRSGCIRDRHHRVILRPTHGKRIRGSGGAGTLFYPHTDCDLPVTGINQSLPNEMPP